MRLASLVRSIQNHHSLVVFFVGMMLGAVLTNTFNMHFQTMQPLVYVRGNSGSGECYLYCGKEIQSLRRQTECPACKGNSSIFPPGVIDPSVSRPATNTVHSASKLSSNDDVRVRASTDVRFISKLTSDDMKRVRLRKAAGDSSKPTFVTTSVDNSDYDSFLRPPSSPISWATDNKTKKFLHQEFSVKEKLLVAVVTCERHMNLARTVNNTWGSDVNHKIFFVGEDCDTSIPSAKGLPLVRLPGVPDKATCSSVNKTFSVLKYLVDNGYTESHQWFLLAEDSMYLRADRLESLLMTLDSTELVYMGRAAKGREKDNLSLLPNEFYCLGGSGVVLSGRLLKELRHHLDYCFNAVSGQEGVVHPDVEVGRCISRKVKVQCSQSSESKTYFFKDYQRRLITLQTLENNDRFDNLITYHPIWSPYTLLVMHYHFKRLQFKNSMVKSQDLMRQVSNLCSSRSIRFLGLRSLSQCVVSTCNDSHSNPSHCPPPSASSPGANRTPPPPPEYPPKTNFNKYDLQSWEYFDQKHFYNDRTVEPLGWLRGPQRREIEMLLNKAVQSASEEYGRPLRLRKVLNGWIRHNPGLGSEFIVDCLFTDISRQNINADVNSERRRKFRKRISLLHPLATNYITVKDSHFADVPVNFIVPVSHVNERLAEFMNMYEEIALQSSENVRLILSVYGDVQDVEKIVMPYKNKYPEATIAILKGRGEFSRGKALDLGISKLREKDLAFFCDADMTVTKPFLDRCRMNAIRGRRVYFPEVFKEYNLDYAYFDSDRPESISIKRTHGHWGYYAYGMVCLYKIDYKTVGGMNTTIVGWGGEDIEFFEKLAKTDMDVLRAPDVGLTHRWHEKYCSKDLSPDQHTSCLRSRAVALADRIDLANYIYLKGMELTPNPSIHTVEGNHTKILYSDSLL